MIDTNIYEPITACPLCASRNNQPIHTEYNRFHGAAEEEKAFFAVYETTPFNISLCLECDFAYTDRLPKDPIFFARLYNRVEYDYAYEFHYHGKKRIFQEIKAQLGRYVSSGVVLDIGTWCGTFPASVSDIYSVTGCELSEKAGSYGQSQGLDIRIASFETAGFAPASFDVITILDVLEHLPRPMQALEKIALLLKSGGILYIKVPNGKGQIKKQRLLNALKLSQTGVAENFIHINHFSHRSLQTALAGAGFAVLEKGYTQPEIWDLSFPQTPVRKVRKWLDNQRKIWTTRLFNQLSKVYPDLGFNIYVIARKM